jgi:hypothetical protein
MTVGPVVLVFGVRKQSRLAIQIAAELSMKNLVDTDDLICSANRQQLQRNPVENGKNSRVHADTQRDRHDRDRREARRFAKYPNCITQVLYEVFEPEPTPCVAGLLREECGIAKRPHGGVPGFLRAHTRGEIFGNLLFEMKSNFVV